MNKKLIRERLLSIRKNLSHAKREQMNQSIQKRLESLDEFKKAKHILFYHSTTDEADTINLIKKYINKKTIYLPLITKPGIFQAVPINESTKIKKGPEGIDEPVINGDAKYDSLIEIIITPGVVFSLKGDRIGMGKGYYDRYFSKNKKAIKIAIAYQEQVLDSIPKESYDEGVDILITDQQTYRFRG